MNDTLKLLQDNLEKYCYFADPALLMSIHISDLLEQPLFLEGEPGVGKTEVAKVLAKLIDGELLRVQCYPGIESSEVLYEWNYMKQILSIRLKESELHRDGNPENGSDIRLSEDLFQQEYLIPRPLLAAILMEKPLVLLIDEVDRADERFEAFLLEFLSDFQISIPELGTIRAINKPKVVLTSNRTRDVHDALRRRCVYHWIEYPSLEREMEIIRKKSKGLSENLVKQICSFMSVVRKYPFDKKPGLSESLDWAKTISSLGLESLFHPSIQYSFSCLFKTKDDYDLSVKSLEAMLKETKSVLSRLG